MSRRRGQPPDSLELLLDTLCNTFGGVLFIALLVVLLLQLSGKSDQNGSPQKPNDDPAALQARLDRLQEEIARQEAMLARFGDMVDPAEADQAALLIQAEQRLRERQNAAMNRQEALREAISRSRATITEINAGLDDLDRRRDQAQAELEQARSTADRERQARARTIGTPLLHETERDSVACELRYGRFYVLHRHGQDGSRQGPNLDDYFILNDTGEELELTPRPTGGLALDDDDEAALSHRFRQALVRCPPKAFHIDLVVRTDSFDTFHRWRRVASNCGYEISVLLVAPGQPVHDQGGTSRGVQ